MYSIYSKLYVNGIYAGESVSTKTYTKKGNADRIASSKLWKDDFYNDNGEHIVKKSYVTKCLNVVPEEIAKQVFCKSKNVYIMGAEGLEQLFPGAWYGSHAPLEELFYRSVGDGYAGSYLVEYDAY